MTKICPTCNKEKEISEFAGGKGRKIYCYDCKREYDKTYYNRTKAERGLKKQQNAAEIHIRNSQYILDYLRVHACVDCGEDDPVVLEFDHLRDKKYSISIMSTHSLDTISKEIEKCEVRCANCHRRKTAKQFNYFRVIA